MTALDKIKGYIDDNKSFVLQGGAGSGKTEALKQALEFTSHNYPKKKIVCITHTNLAVDEIKSRVGEQYTISTIHSFLNSFVKDYKKNIHQVIHKLFQLELMERLEIEDYEGEETAQKKGEHEKYKKIYGKYASTLFTVKEDHVGKVQRKKEYDPNPEEFNATLNEKIRLLNIEIEERITSKDYNQINYNETRFNNFHDLSFGHDGLLDVAHLLFENFPLIRKILQDKFDCIFIDEYQDTNKKIIKLFLNKFLNPDKTLVGLFGDSMQAIYENGVGDVEKYVNHGVLTRIDKEDNYRCSEQVKNFINKLRNDGLVQEIAFKKKDDGTEETLSDRQGSAVLYYSFYEDKPHARSPEEKKDAYQTALNNLIEQAKKGDISSFVQLKLTNKSIAADVGFGALYSIFSERYVEPQEYLERHLERLQLADLFELCNAYKPSSGSSPNYNLVLSIRKKQGFFIRKISDKEAIRNKFDEIINSDEGAIETLNRAFDLCLLKKSERHLEYLEQKDSFFNEANSNDRFQEFKALYWGGKNTFIRIKADLPDLEEDDFNELKRDIKKEVFYNKLFSRNLSFQEIRKYFDYLNENTGYITMHKTKGGQIENVLVVLDEYFWTEYDFKTVFSKETNPKRSKNQKIVYVACSRAKTNLRCVRLIANEEEEADIKRYFDSCTKIER